METSTTIPYNSVPELIVTSSDPVPNGVKQHYQPVILTLSTPVEEKDLERNISVEPEVSDFFVSWNPYDR